MIATLQVQSGGAFDVDYKVTGPNEKIVLEGQKERQGDFVFTANEPGEYRFCFDNEMSTISDKMVDFEIAVGHSTPSIPRQCLYALKCLNSRSMLNVRYRGTG